MITTIQLLVQYQIILNIEMAIMVALLLNQKEKEELWNSGLCLETW